MEICIFLPALELAATWHCRSFMAPRFPLFDASKLYALFQWWTIGPMQCFPLLVIDLYWKCLIPLGRTTLPYE